MTKVNLDDLLRRLRKSADATQANMGEAGGSVVLWVEAHDGRVLCLTEREPFTPEDDDTTEVEVEVLTLGVYVSVERFMDGEPPVVTYVLPPSGKILTRTVRWIMRNDRNWQFKRFYTSADGPEDDATWTVYSEVYAHRDDDEGIEGSIERVSTHASEAEADAEVERLFAEANAREEQ